MSPRASKQRAGEPKPRRKAKARSKSPKRVAKRAVKEPRKQAASKKRAGVPAKKRAKVRSPKKRKTKRLPSLLAAPPARAVAIANELQKLPGVVCVVWGSRKKGTRWFHEEPCLSVHVERKGPPQEYSAEVLPDTLAGLSKLGLGELSRRPLPKAIDGFRVDVLYAGRPKLQSLSAKGRLDSAALGLSTPTIVTTKGNAALALVSGHAAPPATQLTLGGFAGERTGGRFGGGLSVDWAVVRFQNAANSAETEHPVTNSSAPLPLGSGLSGGARLTQFSGARGVEVEGILQGVVPTNVNFQGFVYSSLLSILRTKHGPAFSVDGDSGSLIVDAQGRAVAAVVGGDVQADTFYAYDLRGLRNELAKDDLKRFFEVP